jgi:hypothetical protein
MDIDRSSFKKRLVSFLGIFLGCVTEVSTNKGTAHLLIIATTRDDIVFVAVKCIS